VLPYSTCTFGWVYALAVHTCCAQHRRTCVPVVYGTIVSAAPHSRAPAAVLPGSVTRCWRFSIPAVPVLPPRLPSGRFVLSPHPSCLLAPSRYGVNGRVYGAGGWKTPVRVGVYYPWGRTGLVLFCVCARCGFLSISHIFFGGVALPFLCNQTTDLFYYRRPAWVTSTVKAWELRAILGGRGSISSCLGDCLLFGHGHVTRT